MNHDDAHLAQVLASVGRHLDTDPGSAPAPSPRIGLLRAVALATVVVISASTVAPVRRAVADLFRIGSTVVVRVPHDEALPSALPAISTGLRSIDRVEAERLLQAPLPDTAGSALGIPARLDAMPEGGVLLVWGEGSTTLWIHDEDRPAGVLIKKLLATGQDAHHIDDLGDDAVAISGAHVLVTPHRALAARTVVLWTVEGTELRLESDLPVDTMVQVGRQLTPTDTTVGD